MIQSINTYRRSHIFYCFPIICHHILLILDLSLQISNQRILIILVSLSCLHKTFQLLKHLSLLGGNLILHGIHCLFNDVKLNTLSFT